MPETAEAIQKNLKFAKNSSALPAKNPAKGLKHGEEINSGLLHTH
jgi:hypothetical protein